MKLPTNHRMSPAMRFCTIGLAAFLSAAFLFLGALVSANDPVDESSDDRPNIVFILADDLGIGDVHCYGGERCQIETPNLDALARDGLRFTNAYVNASHCIPTRVAIMTGRYPWRLQKGQPGGPWGFLGPRFDPDTYTLGTMFRGAGYHTCYVGKWHLGTEMSTRDNKLQNESNVDYTRPLKIGPPQYGFDDSFILPGSLDMYPYAFARNNVWQGEVTARKGWSAFHRVGPAEKDFQDHEVLETLYRETESLLKQPRDKPFFLFLALTAPHTPTSPGIKWRGKSKLGVYGDFVMEVDHAVARVREALKLQGVEDNTLVLFSSDHGAASYAGNTLKATPGQIRDLEKQGHYSSGPHRGYKFSVYEGGLHVPLIAHWPAAVKPGGQCSQLVGLCDLLATFAELSGAEVGDQQATDSISFAAQLRQPGRPGSRQDLIMQSIGPFVVRDGDWKLCLCPGSGSTGKYGNIPTPEDAWRGALKLLGRDPRWSDLQATPFVQLFDLAHDPHEDNNLAAEHPQRVADMVRLLREQMTAGRCTPGPKVESQQPNIHQRVPPFVRSRLN